MLVHIPPDIILLLNIIKVELRRRKVAGVKSHKSYNLLVSSLQSPAPWGIRSGFKSIESSFFRDCKGKMKEGIGWYLRISGIKDTSIWCSCLEKLIYNCIKIIPKRIHIKISVRVVLNRSYSTNTQQAWKRLYLTGTWESQIKV